MRELNSNNLKKIVQIWGKAVHNICTTCAQTVSLYTRLHGLNISHVYKPRTYASNYPRFIPPVIPSIFRLFLSVKGSVMPTIHTTYKENNKSKILKSFFLYT